MSHVNETQASLKAGADYFEATFVREIEHSQDAVWAMLTQPAKLVEWLAPGEIELRRGGSAKLDFVDSGIIIDSVVSQFESPRLLAYSWSGPGEPDRPVRWEIESMGDSARLTLTLKSPKDEDIARSCAGWEAHLLMLMAAMESVPIKFPFEHFMSSRETYNQMLSSL